MDLNNMERNILWSYETCQWELICVGRFL